MKYEKSKLPLSSSYHDVAVLGDPLLTGPPCSNSPSTVASKPAATVRILRFGFHRDDSFRGNDLSSCCGLRDAAVAAWRRLPFLSNVRAMAVSVMPSLEWMLSYNFKSDFKGDVVAGLSVGFMIIPQGMAYARVANLPSIFGLYTGFIPCLLYSVFGSSRQLALGPTSLVSLLVGEAITKLVSPDDPSTLDKYISLTLLLSLMMGTIQLLAGIVRLGWIVRFLSHAVVSGFSTGAAIILGFTQTRYFMGYRTKHETIHMIIYDIWEHVSSIHWPSLTMGTISLVFLLVMKHLGKTYKKLRVLRTLGPIVASAVATLVVYICSNPWQIRVTGKVPQGVPRLYLDFPFDQWQDLLTPAFVIASAAYLESIGIAKALAARNGYNVDANQELVGLGIANVGGSFFQAFPTGGSFSRSAVSDECGARTSLAGIVSVLLVLFTLLCLTPVFEFLPLPVLGAILLNSVTGLVDVEEALFLWKVDRQDFAVWMLACCGTLFLGIQAGVMVAVLLSLSFVINESANAQCELLGRLPGTTVFRSVEQYPDAKVTPGIAVVKFHSHLYFANVMNLRDSLRDYENLRGAGKGASAERALDAIALAKSFSEENGAQNDKEEGTGVRYVIIDMTSVHGIDGAALHALKDITREYHERGITIALANPTKGVLEKLDKAGLVDLIGRQWFFVRAYDAVKMCRAYMAVAREAHAHMSPSQTCQPEERGMPPELEWRQCARQCLPKDSPGGGYLFLAGNDSAASPAPMPVEEPLLIPPGQPPFTALPTRDASTMVDVGISCASQEERNALADDLSPPGSPSVMRDGKGGSERRRRLRGRVRAIAAGWGGRESGDLEESAFVTGSVQRKSGGNEVPAGLTRGQLDSGQGDERKGLTPHLAVTAATATGQGQGDRSSARVLPASQSSHSAPEIMSSDHVLVEAAEEESAWIRPKKVERRQGETSKTSTATATATMAQAAPSLQLQATARATGGASALSAAVRAAASPGEIHGAPSSGPTTRHQSGSVRGGLHAALGTPGHLQFCNRCKGLMPLPDGSVVEFEPRHVLVGRCTCTSNADK